MTNQTFQIVSILLISILTLLSCQDPTAPTTATEVAKMATSTEMSTSKEPLLRHVVLFKFKDTSTPADIQKINEAFNALPAAIPVIKDFEWGLNDSPENFHQDFTHCYLLTFASEEDRDSIYAPHPMHKAFGASLDGHLEGVFVVDYWTNP